MRVERAAPATVRDTEVLAAPFEDVVRNHLARMRTTPLQERKDLVFEVTENLHAGWSATAKESSI